MMKEKKGTIEIICIGPKPYSILRVYDPAYDGDIQDFCKRLTFGQATVYRRVTYGPPVMLNKKGEVEQWKAK